MLNIYCGVPGCGKSSLAALYAKKALAKGITVWSNVPISGCYQYTPEDLGTYEICNGLLILDEAGLDFNNRNFKKFTDAQNYFFKYHRHYGVRVLVFSQSWEDMDLKIRLLAHNIYVVRSSPLLSRLGFISTLKVKTKIGIDELTKKLVDQFDLVHPLLGGFRLHFVRPAWKLFDTYERKQLPAKQWMVYK